jgi:hypothetical protein
MDCIVCFDSHTNSIKCYDKNCQIFICPSCFEHYIKHCLDSRILPKCLNSKCNYIYPRKHDIKNYDIAILHSLTNENQEIVSKIVENDLILNKLRNERKVFIDNNFPVAISRVANIIMKQKLMKIEKQKKDKITQIINNSKKKCMNFTCTGYLDDRFKCITCSTQFCNICEMIKKDNHICDTNNIETINIINSMIKCPQCKIPILKSEGCNDMTCTSCNTNFFYDTGTQGGHGNNHNETINITVNASLSKYFHEYLYENDLLDLINKFETFEIKSPNNESVIKLLSTYMYELKTTNINNVEKFAEQISIAYNKYLKKFYSNKKYTTLKVLLEKHCKEKTLTKQIIIDCIKQL